MKFEDKLRFLVTKALFKETVLFSKNDDWEWKIRKSIRGVVPFFYEFNTVNTDRFDLVIPFSIPDQKYLNTFPKSSLLRKVIIPSDNAIDLCYDKERFSEFLIKNGFCEFIPKTNENLDYPYILKKKIGDWGEGISVIVDAKNERLHSMQLESEEYFRQEYIEGQDEYTTHIIIYDKKIIFHRTFQFTFSEKYFVKGRNFKHIKCKDVNHSYLNDLFERILNKLEYQGICCFNYKIFETTVKIFEINHRLGGSAINIITELVISYRDILNSCGK